MLDGFWKLTPVEAFQHLMSESSRLLPADRSRTASLNLPSTLSLHGRPNDCNADTCNPCWSGHCWYCKGRFAGVPKHVLQTGPSCFANSGLGLFLRSGNIPENTILGEYNGRITKTADAYTMMVGSNLITGTNIFRNINHSCDPNCVLMKGTTTPTTGEPARDAVYVASLRCLYEEEELTCSYSEAHGFRRSAKFEISIDSDVSTDDSDSIQPDEFIPPVEGDDPIQPNDVWEMVESKLEFSGWTKRRPPRNIISTSPFWWVKPGKISENGGVLGQDYFDNLFQLQAFCRRVYGWRLQKELVFTCTCNSCFAK